MHTYNLPYYKTYDFDNLFSLYKIEIKLHKQDGGPWATLEVDKSSNKG